MTDLRPWFALKRVPGVGNLLFRRLITRFRTPQAVFQADDEALLAIQGINHKVVTAIRGHAQGFGAIDRELAEIRKKGYAVVTWADPGYPALLRQIPDPPPYLYVYGALPDADLAIAVVGSRNASAYGISATRRLCGDLARQRVTIVSGMARGVDTAAHAGTIAAGGSTVAVLGTGLNCIYPAENRRLFHRIAENGAVVTELALAAGPDAHHFPARNRIISGMCHGTVVVEATGRSGSLITARLAAEQNREVFAVPGNIHSFKSVGTHDLIKQGAKLVVHAGDVLEEFQAVPLHAAPSPEVSPTEVSLTDDEAVVMDSLDVEPVHIDELARRLSMASGRLSGILLQLELKGVAESLPGKRFARVPGAQRKKT